MKAPTKNLSNKKFLGLLAALVLAGSNAFSQTSQSVPAAEPEHFSNPLFMVFAFVIIFLLIIIMVLADVVKGSARIMMDKKKSDGKSGVLLMLLFLVGLQLDASAQASVAANPTTFGGLSAAMFYTLSFVVLFEVGVIIAMIYFIRSFLGINDLKPEMVEERVEVASEPSLIEKLNASVSLEQESEILLDHNYDGIQELDNNLPPWWKYGFYLTIVFAVIYLLNYHVFKTGDLQGAEYNKELAQAAADIAEYQKKSALSVDENTVKILVDETSLGKGKEIYINNCVACHGKYGEGQVGPNLTDNYWIHGSKINDIFKTIKYGYPDKGMKAWKDDLSPSQISFVSSYLKTLVGTNPANPKEKQGELDIDAPQAAVQKNDTTVIDSLKTMSDSLAITKK